MRILITAFYDDNFGDMLIRTCFTQLLKTALENLKITEYEIDAMPLKEPDENKIAAADVLFFAGGGLFGLSYLNFSESLDMIMEIAEKNNTSVIFSSLGSNNMDAGIDDTDKLRDFFRKKCIKAVSVRENPEMFRYYAEETGYKIIQVCDPAVWAGHVYYNDLKKSSERRGGKPVVGINFVRGGLFKANDIDWKYELESTLLYDYAVRLEEQGIDYRFYTNGSAMDCAAMLRFADEYGLPREKFILCDTARDLVRTTADFDVVAATRMHASIVAYALEVPSFNLVWNPKIPFFYENIGYPERALMPEDWNDDVLFEKSLELLSDEDYGRNPEYLMSLYSFLIKVLQDIFNRDRKTETFDYETVCQHLRSMEIPEEEDISDMRFKLLRAENQYNKLRNSKAELREEIREQKRELKALTKENEKLSKKNEKLTEKYEKIRAERNAMKRRLDRIDNKTVVKIYHRLKGTSR